jgi:hypothetical protein
MITFSILLLAVLVLGFVGSIIALAYGAGFFIMYSDIAVCALIIALLIKLFKRKK